MEYVPKTNNRLFSVWIIPYQFCECIFYKMVSNVENQAGSFLRVHLRVVHVTCNMYMHAPNNLITLHPYANVFFSSMLNLNFYWLVVYVNGYLIG